MTKTRQKLHFPLLPQNCTLSFHIMHHIPAHTKLKVTLLLFFFLYLLSKIASASRVAPDFQLFFVLLFVLVSCDFFVRNCLGLERQTCFSPQAVAALAPPKPGFGSHGSCLRQPANPWTCQQNPKLAPIWFVCQFRSAVASALGGRPVFLLVTQDLGPWGVVSANLGIFVPKPSFIYNLFLPIMIWDEKEKHFHCNLVSRRLGVMRQLVPDEYCRGHHSRIIYIKAFLQYITYYTVIRLQGPRKVKLTIMLIFSCWQR